MHQCWRQNSISCRCVSGGENYDLLNARSRTLLKLGLNENALSDAVRVVQIKPKWSKVRLFLYTSYSRLCGMWL